MQKRHWKFSREVGTAAIAAAFTLLFSMLQAYGIFYSVPAEISTVKNDVRELQKLGGDIRERLARVEERLKNDRRTSLDY